MKRVLVLCLVCMLVLSGCITIQVPSNEKSNVSVVEESPKDVSAEELEKIKESLVGVWQIGTPHVAAGVSDAYMFFPDGIVVLGYSQMDGFKLHKEGKWKIDNENVVMNFTKYAYMEGGYPPVYEASNNVERNLGGKIVIEDINEEIVFNMKEEKGVFEDIECNWLTINNERAFYIDDIYGSEFYKVEPSPSTFKYSQVDIDKAIELVKQDVSESDLMGYYIVSEDNESTPAIELAIRRNKDTVIGAWYDVVLYDAAGNPVNVVRCDGGGYLQSESDKEYREPGVNIE